MPSDGLDRRCVPSAPGLYLFEDAPDYHVFRERGRIWRVAARLRPPLPPEDVQFELYPVDGSSDGPVLILSPRAFDAAPPQWLGETVGEAVDALLSEIETDFGRVKALNHALASVSASGDLGADKNQDRQVIGYLTKEVDRILDWIDERHLWVVAHVSAAREPEPEAVDSERLRALRHRPDARVGRLKAVAPQRARRRGGDRSPYRRLRAGLHYRVALPSPAGTLLVGIFVPGRGDVLAAVEEVSPGLPASLVAKAAA